MSELVPCADFVFYVSLESKDIVFHSPGWDTLFAVVYDCNVELIYRSVYVSVVVYVKVCRELRMCRVELSQSAVLYFL